MQRQSALSISQKSFIMIVGYINNMREEEGCRFQQLNQVSAPQHLLYISVQNQVTPWWMQRNWVILLWILLHY